MAGCRAAVPGPGVAEGTPRHCAGPHAAPAGRLHRSPRGCRQTWCRLPAQQQAFRGGGWRGGGTESPAALPSSTPPGRSPPRCGPRTPPPTSGLPGLRRASRSTPRSGEAGGALPPRPAHTPCTPRAAAVAYARSLFLLPPPAAPQPPPAPQRGPAGMCLCRQPRPCPCAASPGLLRRGGRCCAPRHRQPTHGPEHAGTGGHPRGHGRAPAPPPCTYVCSAHAGPGEHRSHRRAHTCAPSGCTQSSTCTGMGGHMHGGRARVCERGHACASRHKCARPGVGKHMRRVRAHMCAWTWVMCAPPTQQGRAHGWHGTVCTSWPCASACTCPHVRR